MSTAIKPLDDEARAIQVASEWTPEALQEAVQREAALRAIVVDYYRSAMKPGHHYYKLPGEQNRKPALSKEGALNLCSLFKVIPQPEEPIETFHPDGHYSVRVRVNLVSAKTGQVLATGDGSCSTRESKYAHRWVWPGDVPAHIDKGTLPRKEFTTKRGSRVTKYRLPNEDLADQYNTVLKMGVKRGTVAAALFLPLASELFTQDLEEQIAEASEAGTSQPEGGGGVASEVSADAGAEAQTEAVHGTDPTHAPAPQEPPGEPITEPQRKKIWAVWRNQHKQPADDLKVFLRKSVTELKKHEARKIIERLEGMSTYEVTEALAEARREAGESP